MAIREPPFDYWIKQKWLISKKDRSNYNISMAFEGALKVEIWFLPDWLSKKRKEQAREKGAFV
jgi:hypothetical protein